MRKCPKCKRQMELLFQTWRCYYCNPSSNKDKNDTDLNIKEIKKPKNEKWNWEDWNGWYD